MARETQVVLQTSVTLFPGRPAQIAADVEMTVAGGPFSIQVSAGEPIRLNDLWTQMSGLLEEVFGFGLPDLSAWSAISGSSLELTPALWIGPSGSNASISSAYLALELSSPIWIGELSSSAR